MYYMIDRRSFIGNCVVFWAKDHKGYTTDIEKSHEFTEAEAIAIERNRSSECAIPKSEVIANAQLVVDFQKLDRKYFKREFKYFHKDQQKSDLEEEIERLRDVIRNMNETVADCAYQADHKGRIDAYAIKQAVERVSRGKPAFEEDE